MFTLQKEPRWTWPVTVRVPGDGVFADHRFSAVFRLVPEERRKELGATEDGLVAILREAVVELRDLVDEDAHPLPHSPELLDAVLANPWLRQGLLLSYAEALAGQPISKVAAGN